ncbi:hypothetical protein BCV70DRAFT_196752 [Testicularia cyperi]|uniref:Uncharacterized protein n=1 Tax=Testicularia cyperi TaxID=1882483 RepID=A0A317XX53_9BASI|nr:hypothetical protein BCV70DRAFT_196752 [Testicularia cyperi]
MSNITGIVPGKELSYRLLCSKHPDPVIPAHEAVRAADPTPPLTAAPSTVRWKLPSGFQRDRSDQRDVLYQSILGVCAFHKLEPVQVSFLRQDKHQYVDVTMATPRQAEKAFDRHISIPYYDTQLQIHDAGIDAHPATMAFCIQFLPASVDLHALADKLQTDQRLERAGVIQDIWALFDIETGKFTGRVVVLFRLKACEGTPMFSARMSVPGHFVFQGKSYLVRFPNRPAWCFDCRFNETVEFHTMHTCPLSPCSTCKDPTHSAITCPTKCKRIAQGTRRKRYGRGRNVSRPPPPSTSHTGAFQDASQTGDSIPQTSSSAIDAKADVTSFFAQDLVDDFDVMSIGSDDSIDS